VRVSLNHLSVYLNDHLAGSAAALELLAGLRKVAGLEEWATRLESEIDADRQELQQLMRRAGIATSRIRQTTAWLTEQLAELKTRLDDRTGGALQQLELIEALALGIDGKAALWASLQAAAADVPALQSVDYSRLIQRAADQRRNVEGRRLLAAAAALGSGVE
jgi:cell division FtsZ-interacting protein ZapD